MAKSSSPAPQQLSPSSPHPPEVKSLQPASSSGQLSSCACLRLLNSKVPGRLGKQKSYPTPSTPPLSQTPADSLGHTLQLLLSRGCLLLPPAPGFLGTAQLHLQGL